MSIRNYVRFEFLSLPENVSFARSCVGAFASQLDCTIEEIEEIKLVVSEAVSNSIIHGYQSQPNGKIEIIATLLDDRTIEIVIADQGKGIRDIQQAMEPSYTTDSNRMGLGFTFMKSFMDQMEIKSEPDAGTSITLKRSFAFRDKAGLA